MEKHKLIGKTFGSLTVLSKVGTTNKRYTFSCLCSCGKIITCIGGNLVSGNTKSCGCLRVGLPHKKKYNKLCANNPTHTSWRSMIARTTNKNDFLHKSYRDRGIVVCKEWLDYNNFVRDMGERPSNTSIDRINNNDGYYKDNCRWATPIQQANNTSRNVFIEYNGERHTVTEWSRILGIRDCTLYSRITNGWSIDRVMTKTVNHYK